MNLIEKFENKPFQNVGTFNSIFVRTPILNKDANTPVRIGRLESGDFRQVFVGSELILLKLNQKQKPLKKQVIKKQGKLKIEKVSDRDNLPSIFKKLTPQQFMVYYAIKLKKVFYGTKELNEELNLCTRTISNCIKHLKKLNYVKSQKVNVDGLIINKIEFVED